MKILLATSNRHKMKELAALLPGVALASPLHLKMRGSSFFENAIIKAKALFNAAGQPVLAR